ncbi:hypothetical protein TSUD_197890 [Trifolium subterraneum]|uniref:Uncharacterized protein n=1 Tax=Trifolium subterraneum TaxID=3900 RepID=A0A2Z6LGA8_TRISU|nr:hypothetical protein TSUD_197890 [Trifolium subterraneum]
MTTIHCSVFSFHASSITRRKPLIIVSSKTARRKNYLRPKILKTLTKSSPIIPSNLPQPHHIISPPQEHEFCVDVPANDTQFEDIIGAVRETGELEEFQVSVDTPKDNGVFGNVSAKDIFIYGGMCIIGAFVIQTVGYFWKLRNQRSNGNLDVIEKRNILFDEIWKTGEDQIVEKKIAEIKLMAREARRIELERKGKEKEDEDLEIDDEEDVVSSAKLGIEKEIVERLLKLKNRINSKKDGVSAMPLNGRGNSAGGSGMHVNQGKDGLASKKKSKFKSPSTKTTKTPKGFSGTQGRRVSNVEPQNHEPVNQQDVTHKNVSGVPLEERGKSVDDKSEEIQNDRKSLEEKMETPNMKTDDGFKTKSINNGGFLETSVGMSSPEVKELRTQDSKGFEKDNVDSINGSSGRVFANKNSALKQANTRTDMWWLNLRYVLVIVMQRGSNEEDPKGLYSLNFTSKQREHNDDSYTVAFEDQADANNFCFLLESFFEELGDDDFSANAVPMSIQELEEEISHGEKVVVVKKRQLQLYAGKLLTDVEMALCSIIEQDQNAP